MEQIDVTLVVGFLEAGKTSYINSLLSQIDENKNILLISCEMGEIDYVERTNLNVVEIEYSEDFNRLELADLKEKYNPDEIIIEVNGMWQLQYVRPALPYGWIVKDLVAIVDSTTFIKYTKNIGSLMNEKVRMATKVIFNRVTEQLADELRKKNLRLANATDEMYLVFNDHKEKYDNGNLRPESLKGSELVINDEDFGFWFSDFSIDPKFYLGKRITLRGLLAKPTSLSSEQFVIGRNAMVCCANDLVFLGMMCNGKTDIAQGSWIEVTGVLDNNPISPSVSPYCIKVEVVEKKEMIADTTVY